MTAAELVAWSALGRADVARAAAAIAQAEVEAFERGDDRMAGELAVARDLAARRDLAGALVLFERLTSSPRIEAETPLADAADLGDNPSTRDQNGWPNHADKRLVSDSVPTPREAGAETETERLAFRTLGEPRASLADFEPVELDAARSDGRPTLEHDVRRLADVTGRRIRWLVPGLVPLRGLTLLAGAGGLGKSTFAMRLAADLSRGRLLEDGEPGSAVIVTTEDTAEEVLRPRAQAADADLDRVMHYRVPLEKGGMLVLPGDFSEFERVVAAAEARLVIIDPILGTLDVALDSHKDQHVRSVLGRLSRIAEELDLAVVMVAHVNKASSRDAYFRVSGSVALYNAARSVVLVTADPENPESTEPGNAVGPVSRIISQHKTNYSHRVPPRRYEIRPIVLSEELDDHGRPLESSAIFYVEDAAGIVLSDLLAEAGAPPTGGQPKTAQAIELLEEMLADGDWHDSAGLKVLAGSQGISERTLKRAAQLLPVDHDRRGFPASTWWRLDQAGHGLSPSPGLTGLASANPHEQTVLEASRLPVAPVGPVGPRQGDAGATDPDDKRPPAV